MVAAGVFLIARMYPVFENIPIAMSVIAWTGAFTAFLGATIALTQNDIKKGLAYLNNNRSAEGSYGYTSGSGGKPTLTAIGVMCFAIAKQKDTKGFENSVNYLKKNHNLLIGERTAELIKREIGSAVELDPELELSVKGRDLVSGIPKIRTISSEDVRDALREPVGQIASAVTRALERTPPELGGDVLERGIMLTGGGSLLKGLDVLIRSRVELPVYVAEDPGNLQIVALTPSGGVVPIVEITGQSGTEVTGPALDPSGTRLYFSSQRNPGTTYEVTGPFAPANAVPSMGSAGRGALFGLIAWLSARRIIG